jgi:hypothetical protein
MSTTISFTLQLKPLLEALLAFGTVMVLKRPELADTLSKFGEKQEAVIIFIVILLVQILFEMLYKYEAKVCELTEGIFAAVSAIIGYFLGVMIGEKLNAGSTASSAPQKGGAIPVSITGALGAGVGIFLWKKLFKLILLPGECLPCQPLVCAPCPPQIIQQIAPQPIQK